MGVRLEDLLWLGCGGLWEANNRSTISCECVLVEKANK